MLAASFAGMVAVSPLAGRIVERVPAERAAAAGAVLAGMGLFLVATWTPGRPAETVVILGILLLQGLGMGLFQVSYMEVVMRTLPPHQRGVAGSLAMLTRTIGIIGGAPADARFRHGRASVCRTLGRHQAAIREGEPVRADPA